MPTPDDQTTGAPHDSRPATPPTTTPDAFSAAMESEVCRRVLGARRHGLTP